ncbi:MAG: hypothetical protein GYA17_13080, partial [Chloroflexi bacterium]|nr:hypothetical protein [Chloroflexota bacterium]
AWALALMQRSTRREAVEQALQAAQDALERTGAGDELRRLVAGHVASIRGMLLQAPVLAGERPERLVEVSQRAQELLPPDEHGIRSVNALNLGYAYMALGDAASAGQFFTQTLEEGLQGGNLYAAVYGPIGLIWIAMAQGRLREAFQVCETNLRRFEGILEGQRFPPIGALYILKGSLLLEQNHLEEARQALERGIDLVRWTGEYEAHMKGYTALARLCAAGGDWPGAAANAQTLEDTWPEGALYAQALRHRLLLRCGACDEGFERPVDAARAWLESLELDFESQPAGSGMDPMSEITFQTFLGITHVLAGLGEAERLAGRFRAAQAYLARQQEFARRHGLFHWLVECGVARARLYQATGEADAAREMLLGALAAAAGRGYVRIFVDEGNALGSLLEQIRPRLEDPDLYAVAERILDALGQERDAAQPEGAAGQDGLSEREIEVLRFLADGLTYGDIAGRLFISVNTVRYHIKSLYRKLGASTRAGAIAGGRRAGWI